MALFRTKTANPPEENASPQVPPAGQPACLMNSQANASAQGSLTPPDPQFGSVAGQRTGSPLQRLGIEELEQAAPEEIADLKANHVPPAVVVSMRGETMMRIQERFHNGTYDAAVMPLVEEYLTEMEHLAHLQADKIEIVVYRRVADVKEAKQKAYDAVAEARREREQVILDEYNAHQARRAEKTRAEAEEKAEQTARKKALKTAKKERRVQKKTDRISRKQAEKNRARQAKAYEQALLDTKARIENEEALAALETEHEQRIAQLRAEHEQKITQLKTQNEQIVTQMTVDSNQKVTQLKADNEEIVTRMALDSSQKVTKLIADNEEMLRNARRMRIEGLAAESEVASQFVGQLDQASDQISAVSKKLSEYLDKQKEFTAVMDSASAATQAWTEALETTTAAEKAASEERVAQTKASIEGASTAAAAATEAKVAAAMAKAAAESATETAKAAAAVAEVATSITSALAENVETLIPADDDTTPDAAPTEEGDTTSTAPAETTLFARLQSRGRSLLASMRGERKSKGEPEAEQNAENATSEEGADAATGEQPAAEQAISEDSVPSEEQPGEESVASAEGSETEENPAATGETTEPEQETGGSSDEETVVDHPGGDNDSDDEEASKQTAEGDPGDMTT